MAFKLESAKRLARYHRQKQSEADEMSQFKTKSAEACTIENQEVCESYCKGESFGVQDLLNATETMQFPWSGRCSGGL